MHLLDRYALSCGVKIDKPYIHEVFFPLTFDKYVTFHPFSKYPSKQYDYWQDVIDIIHPIFTKNNIFILQIGDRNDRPIQGCIHIQGQTNLNQAAYLINKSMAHFGADSFSAHVAGGFNKKLLALYSNNYINVVRPYFGDKNQQILLEPDRKGKKPNFSVDEFPKTINEIKPEKIAQAICQLVGLEFDFKYEFIHFGCDYRDILFESVPNKIIDNYTLGLGNIIVRMDLLFNEQNLVQQLKKCPCIIVTDKPIHSKIMMDFKSNILEIFYFIKENHNPQFVDFMQKNGFKYNMVSFLDQHKLNELKLDYMDYGIIFRRDVFDPPFDRNDPNIFYKSRKFILSNGKIYLSAAAEKADIPTDTFANNIQQIINTPEFWEEACFYSFLKKLD